jgi:hypothetical protein
MAPPRDSPSKGTGDGRCTALDTWEQSVKDTLTSEERVRCGLLLGDGSGRTDRPELHHLVLGRLALELGFENDVLSVSGNVICIPVVRGGLAAKSTRTHVNGVRPLLRDPGDGSHGPRGEHDLVVVDERVLVHGAKDVSSRDVVADPERGGVEVPLDLSAEGLGVDTA